MEEIELFTAKSSKVVDKTLKVWEREYKKGFFPFLILFLLRSKEGYGYEIATRLRAKATEMVGRLDKGAKLDAEAAALNVKVNTKAMKDRAQAEALNRRTEELMDRYWKIAECVYEQVYGRLS